MTDKQILERIKALALEVIEMGVTGQVRKAMRSIIREVDSILARMEKRRKALESRIILKEK